MRSPFELARSPALFDNDIGNAARKARDVKRRAVHHFDPHDAFDWNARQLIGGAGGFAGNPLPIDQQIFVRLPKAARGVSAAATTSAAIAKIEAGNPLDQVERVARCILGEVYRAIGFARSLGRRFGGDILRAQWRNPASKPACEPNGKRQQPCLQATN